MKYILFIIITVAIYSENIYIASFNTLHLGWKGKDYVKTAKILCQFDIIGLQEVMNEKGLLELRKELENYTDKTWNYHISEKNVGNGKYKEYYAYLWKKDKAKMIGNIGFYNEESEDDFSREPYAVEFKTGNFDFIFVLNHIIYGKKKAQRVSEIEKLGKVYKYFQDIDDENDILIGGDFNVKASDKAFENLLNIEDEIHYVVNSNRKTTIGKKKLSSSYDNMFFSKKYMSEFTGKYGVYDFRESNNEELRKKVSDHLPIFIQIENSMEDDD